MKRIVLAVLFLFFISYANEPVFAERQILASEKIGEAFGRPVNAAEFYYFYKTASIFTRTGKDNRSEDETRAEAWQNLIFRYEAARLNITVTPEEVKKELERLLLQKNIEYGSDKYRVWAMEQFQEDAGILERRISDLLIISKLLEIKTNPEVTVTEKEAKEKFLNQYNSFESEYIRFETGQEAEDFAKKASKSPKLWFDAYREKKPLGQKGAAWINIMSLEALIDLWKIPKEDAYRILGHNKGDFIPVKFYYGDAAFRLLDKKEADVSQYDDKKKQYYINTITQSKKYRIAKEYFDDLIKRASYRDYEAEKRKEVKLQELKNKSLIVLDTTQGEITVQLFPEKAPLACENFIALAEKNYYNGIIFHRVIKGFMIQGGDPTGTGTGGNSIWEKPFQDEVSADLTFNKKGLLAMANSGPNTNGSQFFITTKETPWLNGKHTIFGEVISGYDVVEKIENVAKDSSDKPKKEQKIIKAYIKTGPSLI